MTDPWKILLDVLQENADDEINRQNGAAIGYENALLMVKAHRDAINSEAVRRGARIGMHQPAAPAAFVEDWSDPAMDVYDAAPAEGLDVLTQARDRLQTIWENIGTGHDNPEDHELVAQTCWFAMQELDRALAAPAEGREREAYEAGRLAGYEYGIDLGKGESFTPAAPAEGLDGTRPCTEGPDGGTCDGSDHVRHLVWSCFTATEMGRHRDAYAKATLTRMAHSPAPAEGLDVERLARAIRATFGGTPPTARQQADRIAREYAKEQTNA